MKKRILTGIKPTGIPHIGNYFGAIRPAIEMANSSGDESLFFIADYHALNSIKSREQIEEYSRKLAATWLACGLDDKKMLFYRQSDIPETFELCWILSNVTPKGLINRAHAYKACIEKNIETGKDPDDGVNMGLFNYPVLMAADILLMNSAYVPVGRDQKQHVEIAREIARLFNNTYDETFILPEEKLTEGVDTVMGLDGRKMSKSYGNVIPLFDDEKTLQKNINRIITNSQTPDERKSIDCPIFKIFSLFASENEINDMKIRFENGIGWGEVKKETFVVANRTIAPMREKYNFYMSHPEEIEKILKSGAEKARKIACETLNRVRNKII